MTQVVSKAVADGIDQIKASGRCNMQDTRTVIKIAQELGLLELAHYVSTSEPAYQACLANGYVYEEEVAAAESAVVEEDVEIQEAEEPEEYDPEVDEDLEEVDEEDDQ